MILLINNNSYFNISNYSTNDNDNDNTNHNDNENNNNDNDDDNNNQLTRSWSRRWRQRRNP